jgi:hypothetical protein
MAHSEFDLVDYRYLMHYTVLEWESTKDIPRK